MFLADPIYVDDTLIYAEEETDEQCKQYLPHDINNINYWLKMNKLKLNEINNDENEKVNRIKYLRFIVDKNKIK